MTHVVVAGAEGSKGVRMTPSLGDLVLGRGAAWGAGAGREVGAEKYDAAEEDSNYFDV